MTKHVATSPRGQGRPGGGGLPEEPRRPEPDEPPDQGPAGPRTPYPVDDPGISDPNGPGSEPDYFPGKPADPLPRF